LPAGHELKLETVSQHLRPEPGVVIDEGRLAECPSYRGGRQGVEARRFPSRAGGRSEWMVPSTSVIQKPTRAKIRVAHCIWDTTACGAQEVLRLLLSDLDPDRFRSTVFTFRRGAVADLIEQQGIEVVELRPGVRKLDPSLVWRLRSRLKVGGYHALHTHLFGATLHGVLAARGLAGLVSVVTLHTVREDNLWQRLAYGQLLKRVSIAVACSEKVADEMGRRYAAFLAGRLRTIPNGIDVARYGGFSRSLSRSELGLDEGAPVVVAVGRLGDAKGYPILLNAMSMLLARLPDATLLIAGEGPLRSRLEGQAQELGIGRHVRFLGARSDVPRILAAGDVFALSSLWEGLPMALLEAMAAGIPCAATGVGGIPEAMKDQEEGLVVPPNDAGALAAALARCLEDRDFASRLAQRARARVERDFSARRMAREYASLYEELVTRQRAQQRGR
jgi:glycosyltransferase involved in cell wall biosynthesis